MPAFAYNFKQKELVFTGSALLCLNGRLIEAVKIVAIRVDRHCGAELVAPLAGYVVAGRLNGTDEIAE